MKRALIATATAVAGLLASAALAEPPGRVPERLTPADAVTRALAGHPSTDAARAEARRADSALAEAEAGRLPRVDLEASVTRFQEEMPVTPIHGFTPGSFPEFDDTLIRGDLTAQYTLFDGGDLAGRMGRAAALAGAAGAAVDASAQAVAAGTLRAYLRLLTARETLAASDLRVAAVSAERDRVAQVFEVGRAPEVDVARAEAALASAEADRVRTVAELERASRELGRWIGGGSDDLGAPVPPEALVPIAAPADSDPDPDLDREALYRSVDTSPAVVRARQEVAAAEAAAEVARSARRPRLAAFGALQEYGAADGTHDLEWNAGLRLAVPIFHGGALDEEEVQAEAVRDAAEARLRLAILDARSEVDRAIASYEEARARAVALGRAVERQAEVARIEKLRLDAGAGVEADYLEAEAELLGVRASRVEASHAAAAARVDLGRIAAELSPAWAEAHLPPPSPEIEEDAP